MSIQFRSNRKDLPPNKDGYFFCRMSRGAFGSPKTFQFFLTGILEGGVLKVEKWKVPEMLSEGVEVRDPETAGICLIKRPKSPDVFGDKDEEVRFDIRK